MSVIFYLYTYIWAPACVIAITKGLFLDLLGRLVQRYRNKQKRKALPDSSSTTLELSEISSVGKINKKLRQLRDEKIEEMNREAEGLFQRQKIDLENHLDEDILPQMYAQAEDPRQKAEFVIKLRDVVSDIPISIPWILSPAECERLLDTLGEFLKERGIVAIRHEFITIDNCRCRCFLVKW